MTLFYMMMSSLLILVVVIFSCRRTFIRQGSCLNTACVLRPSDLRTWYP